MEEPWQVALFWMVMGILALLVAKYLVFGLAAWDATLHPGRVEPANLAWAEQPMLGAVWGQK
jgi:hypothetical protein